jgi:hypothetical protein
MGWIKNKSRPASQKGCTPYQMAGRVLFNKDMLQKKLEQKKVCGLTEMGSMTTQASTARHNNMTEEGGSQRGDMYILKSLII